MPLNDFHGTPNKLAAHYRRFRVSERLLLTGHSHQAWPDCAFEAHQQAWLDAAEYVDQKWERAFARAERVRRGFAALLEDTSGHYALGASTHELVVRFLSALPLERRPRLVTTDSEFHTLRRQLDALAATGKVEVVRVPAHPVGECAGRIAAVVDDKTAAVLVSAVFFNSGQILGDLPTVARACHNSGARLLVDVYHALNVVPFSIDTHDLHDAFIVGGGYKYCQLGEGNCFLRFPERSGLKPVITGWFSEFSALARNHESGQVAYGQGADLFAGSTYDPTSHYRAARVFDFFEEQGLHVALLRQISQHQIGMLANSFDRLCLDPAVIRRALDVPLDQIAGFLVLRSEKANDISKVLATHGVLTDARRDALRLGPAPYVSDGQLETAMQVLGEVLD